MTGRNNDLRSNEREVERTSRGRLSPPISDESIARDDDEKKSDRAMNKRPSDPEAQTESIPFPLFSPCFPSLRGIFSFPSLFHHGDW